MSLGESAGFAWRTKPHPTFGDLLFARVRPLLSCLRLFFVIKHLFDFSEIFLRRTS